MALLITARVPTYIAAIEAMCEGLTGLNFRMMSLAKRLGGDGFPALYESGVVYRREDRGKEHWQTATDLLKAGFGDCEDLAAYRAAELRLEGEPASVAIVKTRRGSYHAVVRRADGEIEDPSRILLALEGVSQSNLR